MATEDVIKLLEELRADFDYESREYGNPGSGLDPFVYGTYEGKSEAYEDAKFRLDEVIRKAKGRS